ncbi:MAG: FecR family protein [Rhodocyclales bacterium]|nr:FecR family protein [Rhodocyclales bacterium]
MHRRKLLGGLAALIAAERLITLNAAWAAGNRPLPPGLHSASGDVRINGRPASAGMPVQPGDTISTSEGAQAIYIVGRDAYLQRERSSVQLLGESLSNGLRVVSGKLLSVFGKGDKRIETPTATIGIRGTGCYIEADEKEVYFCLCYGTAEIIPRADPGLREVITTRHHDHPLTIVANSTQMMAPASVKNHSDDELVLLESLVGRYPPFIGQGYKSY